MNSLFSCSVTPTMEDTIMEERSELMLKRSEIKTYRVLRSNKVDLVTARVTKFKDSGSDIEHEAFLALWLSWFVFPLSYSTVTKNVLEIAVHLGRGLRLALAPPVLASVYRDLFNERMASMLMNGVWGGNWEWCSSPRGRTLDEVSELSRLIGTLILTSEQQDGWRWKLNPNGKFTVNNLSKLIDIAILGSNVMSYKVDWNWFVLKKVNICIWRAVNDRLPTRANLLLRGLMMHRTWQGRTFIKVR
ncbi:RNA-directed DNA polymerase, eukaryota, reverse transcriptase zinc-binding domain protein [Tanacetum coccineum]